MKVNALNLKNWCNDRITPLAWQRVIMRALPTLREMGHSLSSLENPDGQLVLEDEVVEVLTKALMDLYTEVLPVELEYIK